MPGNFQLAFVFCPLSLSSPYRTQNTKTRSSLHPPALVLFCLQSRQPVRILFLFFFVSIVPSILPSHHHVCCPCLYRLLVSDRRILPCGAKARQERLFPTFAVSCLSSLIPPPPSSFYKYTACLSPPQPVLPITHDPVRSRRALVVCSRYLRLLTLAGPTGRICTRV